MENQKPQVDECALWFKKTKNDDEYLSGIVKVNGEEFRIVAFANNKTKETQPDYSFKQKNEANQDTSYIR